MDTSVTRQELLDLIDKELSAHEQCIKELKARRNATVCISTLPVELLVDIFLLVQIDSHVKKWHRIAHVCQHWRQLAITTPILWTRPPIVLHDYTTLMLERSRTAGLDIFFMSSVAPNTLSALLNHIGHTRSLHMDMGDSELDHVCSRLLSSGQRFSRLESLTIELDASAWGEDEPTWIFPSALIQDLSSFHSLRLGDVIIDWHVLTSVNLTSLDIYHAKSSEQITVELLLDNLKAMPRLQYLSMSLHKLLVADPPSITRTDKTALLHLQNLNLADCFPAQIPYLLDHLDLPCLRGLHINAHDLRNVQSYSSKALPPIISTLSRGAFVIGRRLEVSPSGIHVSASGAQDPFFCLDIPPTRDEDEPPRSYELLRQMAPLFTDLVQLNLDIPLSSDDLSELFGNKHQLKAVTLRDSELLTSFAEALSTCSCVTTPAPGAHTFPALDTICLSEMFWARLDPEVIVNLCSAIRSHAAHTIAFKTVYWCDYYISVPDWVRKLLQEKLTGGGTQVKRGLIPPEYGC